MIQRRVDEPAREGRQHGSRGTVVYSPAGQRDHQATRCHPAGAIRRATAGSRIGILWRGISGTPVFGGQRRARESSDSHAWATRRRPLPDRAQRCCGETRTRAFDQAAVLARGTHLSGAAQPPGAGAVPRNVRLGAGPPIPPPVRTGIATVRVHAALAHAQPSGRVIIAGVRVELAVPDCSLLRSLRSSRRVATWHVLSHALRRAEVRP